MSYVTFDCTQFISFDSDNEADVNEDRILYHASCFGNAGNIVVLKIKSNDES